MTVLKFAIFLEQIHEVFARLSTGTQDVTSSEKVTVFWTLTVTLQSSEGDRKNQGL